MAMGMKAMLILLLVITSGAIDCAYAEPRELAIKKVETKEVMGELIFVQPRKRLTHIGIASKDADAYFAVDEDVVIVHKKSLDEIALGDMISVIYEETTRVTEAGKERTKRVAKVIKFVKKGAGNSLMRGLPGDTRKFRGASESRVLRSLERRQ